MFAANRTTRTATAITGIESTVRQPKSCWHTSRVWWKDDGLRQPAGSHFFEESLPTQLGTQRHDRAENQKQTTTTKRKETTMTMSDTLEPGDPSASDSAKPDKFSFEWWEGRGNAGRCVGHRKNGDRCKRPTDPGAAVCGHHGARAPQVKAKARQRIEEAADRMAKALLKMASDENVSEVVRLRAITDALSRAGITEKTAVEVEVSLKPFEQIITRVESGSRAAYRASVGRPDSIPTALADRPAETQHDDGYLTAEIVSPAEEFVSRFVGRSVNDSDGPMAYDDAEHPRDERTAAGKPPSGGSMGGMMPLEDALEEAARLRRNAPPMPPPLGLRALPPGRSP
jgi:hypothetical protein